MMRLEPHGSDTYVGVGPSYPWGGLYGGQIVAQSLRAAAMSVEDALAVHSLHAYFIRLGDADQPIRFEVDRIRSGKSFVMRRVVARQSGGAILNMAASFQAPEDSPEIQSVAPGDLPDPETVESDSWSPVFDRRSVARFEEPGRARSWMRMSEVLGDDPMIQSCALAWLSDDLPTEAVVALHPDRSAPGSEESPFWGASLDHAVWFHRPMRADEWHVHEFTCHGLMSSRGLALGHVFTRDGSHVATVTQEVLLRQLRAPGASGG